VFPLGACCDVHKKNDTIWFLFLSLLTRIQTPQHTRTRIQCPAGEYVIKVGQCDAAECTVLPFMDVETRRVGECCGANALCISVLCEGDTYRADATKICIDVACTISECCLPKAKCSSLTCDAFTHSKGGAVVCKGGTCVQTECCNLNQACGADSVVCLAGTTKTGAAEKVCIGELCGRYCCKLATRDAILRCSLTCAPFISRCSLICALTHAIDYYNANHFNRQS